MLHLLTALALALPATDPVCVTTDGVNCLGSAAHPLMTVGGGGGGGNVTVTGPLGAGGQSSGVLTTPIAHAIDLSLGTLSAAGNTLLSPTLVDFGDNRDISAAITIATASGGGTSITFTLASVDGAGNAMTLRTGPALTVAGAPAAVIRTTVLTSALRVSWTVAGGAPSFTGVHVYIYSSSTPYFNRDDTLAGGGTMIVEGPLTAGSLGTGADPTRPLLVGAVGTDNNAHYVRMGATGDLQTDGPVANNSNYTGFNPNVAAGLEDNGTTTRGLNTDSSGRLRSVGAAANGAAVTGNPILQAGTDGANTRTISTDASGRQVAVGPAAAGAAVTGNPVLQAGTDGANVETISLAQSGSDGVATSSWNTNSNSDSYLFNESGWDRRRSNVNYTDLASAARTASTNGPARTNFNGRSWQVILNVTVASGTGGLQVLLQAQDPVSGNFYALNNTPTAVVAAGTFVYEVNQAGNTGSGGVTQRTSGAVPQNLRVRVVHGDASSYTYSVASFVSL